MVNKEIIILDEYVDVSIASQNINYYKQLGYNIRMGDIITIPISHLSEKSRIKVNVKCPNEMCGKVRGVDYRDICKQKHTYCNSCASSITHKKDYKCFYCDNKAKRIFEEKHVCDKHYGHLIRYGYVLERTCKDLNEIEEFDDYIKVYTYDKTQNISNFFIIDKDSYEKIKMHKWSSFINQHSIGVSGVVDGKLVKLNRFLLDGIKPNEFAIHLNGDKFDFRKNNLKISSQKLIQKEILPDNEDMVEIIDNIKIEKIDEKTYKLLNIRNYSKNYGNMKDIIVKIDNNGCWNCVSHGKYRGGYIQLYKNGTKVKLHREVLSMKMNRKLEDWEMTRHQCDNPQCCNPKHLIVGTAEDNYNDMIRRGRAFFQRYPKEKKQIIKRKVKDKMTITNEDDVRFIYKKIVGENMSQTDFCKKYNYTRGIVNNIINKITWKHITDEIDKTIIDKRKQDVIDKINLVNNLSRGGIYTNRYISFLTGINRETVRGIINKEIYNEYISNIDFKTQEPVIYICDIKHDTIVDGENFRSSVYCSFCTHKCSGCHNQNTWSITNGNPISITDVYNDLVLNEETDVTFTGGDPMFQAKAFSILAKKIKENTNKTIWIYSGFAYDDIIKDKNKRELLKLCDVLVDGRFIEDKKDPTLNFRGSSNQRIIDIKESLKQNKVILYQYN